MENSPHRQKLDPELLIERMLKVYRGLVSAGQLASRNEQELIKLQDDVQVVCQQMRQRRRFNNHGEAFDEARRIILQELKSDPVLTVKVIAISSSYSWLFLTSVVPIILQEYPNANCVLDIVLVDPDFLVSAATGKNKTGAEWSKLSGSRLEGARQLLQEMDPDLRSRYRISLSYYKNIPHWHGVLINGTRLLVARCSWERGKNKLLNLRAGENTYQSFFHENEEGPENIASFENWFEYYSETGRKCDLNTAED